MPHARRRGAESAAAQTSALLFDTRPGVAILLLIEDTVERRHDECPITMPAPPARHMQRFATVVVCCTASAEHAGSATPTMPPLRLYVARMQDADRNTGKEAR